MLASLSLLAALGFGPSLAAGRVSAAPSYTAAGIVNTVTGESGALAPNTPISIFGTDLAYGTHALTPADIQADALPVVFASEEVRVYVGNAAAFLTYVSPTQINLLVPESLRPGTVKVRVVRQGIAGPAVEVTLLDAAPGLFSSDGFVTAVHEDWTQVTKDSPARPGEVIQLYAAGLGRAAARLRDGALLTPPLPPELDDSSLRISRFSELRVLLNGEDIARDLILTAARTPGCAGLFQVVLRMPDQIPVENPEIRIGLGEQLSPTGVRLPAQATSAALAAF